MGGSAAARINSYADARELARRSIPSGLCEYLEGGAEAEVTMTANDRAFRELFFKPRAGRGLEGPNLATTVLGMPVAFPILLAPCGLIQLMHPEGPVAAFRAAHDLGTIGVLSTFAGCPPETLSDEPGPRWFQLYATNEDMANDLVERARRANYDALVVTMDSTTGGIRERDVRSGANRAMELNARNVIRLAPQVVARPRWAMRMVGTSIATLRGATLPGGKITSPIGPPRDPAATGPLRVSPFTWDDVKRIRDQWDGPFAVKSILSAEDAEACVRIGADAIIVSNHGGRQLDSAPVALKMLPEVVDAVGGRAEVLFDSGIRRGSDAVKAIALGARAVFIGRPYMFAMAAAGEAGVNRMLRVMRDDMARVMALLGCHSVDELDESWLRLD